MWVMKQEERRDGEDEGCCLLERCEGLRHAPSQLTVTFSRSRNVIGDEGAAILAAELPSLTRLQRLGLGYVAPAAVGGLVFLLTLGLLVAAYLRRRATRGFTLAVCLSPSTSTRDHLQVSEVLIEHFFYRSSAQMAKR